MVGGGEGGWRGWSGGNETMRWGGTVGKGGGFGRERGWVETGYGGVGVRVKAD